MPPAKKSPDGLASPALRELSPEQVSRMESKRAEAEARLLTKKMGVATASIGPTWMQALLPEFKKPYIEEVSSLCTCLYVWYCGRIRNFVCSIYYDTLVYG